MIFAVLDPSPLTVCINCSFFTFISLITNSCFHDFAFIVQYSSKINSTFLVLFDMFLFTTGHFCMCVFGKKTYLFSTLILGSVFSDYVVFYGDRSS